MRIRLSTAATVVLSVCAAAGAQRQITADAYLDKVHGMWLGQVIGNYAGRGVIPGTQIDREGHVVRLGADYDVGWDAILATDPWEADDDTATEYLYLDLLATTAEPAAADLRQAWMANISAGDVYIANKQARWLMEPAPVGEGLSPAATGSLHENMHAYAIDAQISTEALGALSPGLRQHAADLVRPFAEVTNDGFPVHAAQFYGAMYAAAALESDVEAVVGSALAVVPASSRTHQVIDDVLACYAADKSGGQLGDPNAWRDTQAMLYDNYGSSGGSHCRYRFWIESTVNVGLTVMSLLYGQGDFKTTVEIGVLAGYDADCNPATAGGLLGMIKGYQGAGGSGGILDELPAVPADDYDTSCLGAVGGSTTITQVAELARTAGEAQILAAGGSIDGSGPARLYTLPPDDVSQPAERWDPAGPRGLVGQVLAAGGEVTVSASVARYVTGCDRQNLDGIIDGIADVSYNGHVPYWTSDVEANQPAGGDYYQLTFDRPVTFRSVCFHEGDIRWDGINTNPRQVAPRGGYFLDLTVEVLVDGAFDAVSGLSMSEPLDANTYYQHIELTFEAVTGEAIRIRGTAGGTRQFTTIVELEAFGAMGVMGDADEDGDVDFADYDALRRHFGCLDANWSRGDFDLDGDVDWRDYAALKRRFGFGVPAPGSVPEPAAATLLAVPAGLLLRRRRRTG